MRKYPRGIGWAIGCVVALVAGTVLVIARNYNGIVIDREVALAIYSSQIQLFAIFGAIAPIFYVFYQSGKRTTHGFRWATFYACVEISLSVLGVGITSWEMIQERFDVGSVVTPFILVVILAGALIGYLIIVTVVPPSKL